MAISLKIRSNTTRSYPQTGNENWGTEATNWARDATNAINASPENSESWQFDAIVGSASDVTAGSATHSDIDTAIGAVSAGDVILLLDGTYSLASQLDVDKAVTIIGQGSGTVIESAAGIASGAIVKVSTDDVTLQNFKIDDGTGTPDYALQLDAGVTRVNATVKVEGTYAIAFLNNASDCFSITGDDGIIAGPSGDIKIQVKDNDATALEIGSSGVANLLSFDTSTGAAKITINGDLDVSGAIDIDTVKLNDSDDSHDLELVWDEDDTSDRTLNFKVGSGSRTVTLNENLTVGDGYDVTVTAEDAATAVTMDNANFEVESTDGSQRDFKITSAKAGNITLTFQENLTIQDGQDVTITAEDAATSIVMDNVNFEVENTDGTQRNVKITSSKAGNTTLTLEEDLTVGDGYDVTVTAEDAATAVTMDNANFEVESTDGSQRDFKITSAKAGNTTLTFEEDLTIGDGYDITITAEDAASAIVLDNANFEVESTDGSQRDFKITSAKAGNTTLTFEEDLTIGDGQDVTITAEDSSSSIVMDQANFEVERDGGTQRDLKLSIGSDANAALTITGTSGSINQDVSSDADPDFNSVGIASAVDFDNQAESKFYEQTGNGTNYIGITAPDAVTDTRTLKLPDGAGSNGQVLTTDGNSPAALSWTSPLVNPMDSEGDLILGGAGGAATKLDEPGDSKTSVLTTDGAGNVAWDATPTVEQLKIDGASDNGDGFIFLNHQSADAGTPGSGTSHVKLYANSKLPKMVVDNGSGTPVVYFISPRVAATAYMTANQTIATGSNITVGASTNTTIIQNTNSALSTSGVFTAPYTGFYASVINAVLDCAAGGWNTTTEFWAIKISENGSARDLFVFVPQHSMNVTKTGVALSYLTAGQTLSFLVRQTSGGNKTLFGTSGNTTFGFYMV